ncbi:MAG: hypothetical protein MJZ65_00495 [Paludibacteraceae bacterium]|nr:hypothetical protein [Paludibacteraceae bacterium]
MKKGLLVLVCLVCALSAWSVNYCQTAAFGYGAAATGGGNATPTLVDNYDALKSAMGSSNKVIIITKSIAFSTQIECSKSNLTILGMPGVILSNSNKDEGVFKFKGKNIIIRNIAFKGPGATNNQGGDLLCFEGTGASTAWVDHCSFEDGSDGNFDICKGADNITVTWCRFLYKKTTDHNFSNLVGSSSSDAAADGTFNITYAYCWWDEGCAQRMPRSRHAQFHLLNCYWNSSDASYYLGLQTSTAYIEGCYFGGSLSGGKIVGSGNSWYDANTIGYVFVNCVSSKTLPSNNTKVSVAKPTYTYPTAVTANEAKTMVTNSSCGAGATLTVTKEGAVSSSCDSGQGGEGGEQGGGGGEQGGEQGGGDTPIPPSPVGTTTFWNFSDAAFKDLGTLTASKTIQGLLITADGSEGKVVVDANSKSIDGYSFTSRLKTGGPMSATARYLSFTVTGNCTIEIYCISSSSSATRTMNVATGTWDNTKQTYSVAGNGIAKYTYSYTGTGTTIYIGSADGGINFYAIKVIYPAATGLYQTSGTSMPTKFMYKGHLMMMLHAGHWYNNVGQIIR